MHEIRYNPGSVKTKGTILPGILRAQGRGWFDTADNGVIETKIVLLGEKWHAVKSASAGRSPLVRLLITLFALVVVPCKNSGSAAMSS